jgi:cytochrome d ubiquinol oxidase subunit II
VNPASILGGVLAVVVAACLSSVYLTFDAARLEHGDLVEYFRRRAVGAAVFAGVVLAAGAFVLHADAEYLFDGLTSRALPLVVVSAACGIGSLVLLLHSSHRGARLLAGGAVVAMVASWGVAQWDYLLPESLTVADGAAPDGTLEAVLFATALAVLLIFPSLGVLYRLGQKGLLPDEGVDDEAPSMA